MVILPVFNLFEEAEDLVEEEVLVDLVEEEEAAVDSLEEEEKAVDYLEEVPRNQVVVVGSVLVKNQQPLQNKQPNHRVGFQNQNQPQSQVTHRKKQVGCLDQNPKLVLDQELKNQLQKQQPKEVRPIRKNLVLQQENLLNLDLVQVEQPISTTMPPIVTIVLWECLLVIRCLELHTVLEVVGFGLFIF